jgi:hypothetical protein
MDETIAPDLNVKLALRLRLIRGVAAPVWTCQANRLASGQFLRIADQRGTPAAGRHPTDPHVGTDEAA